jgi:hypothetical protein
MSELALTKDIDGLYVVTELSTGSRVGVEAFTKNVPLILLLLNYINTGS